MINSLIKDSHITQSLRHSQKLYSHKRGADKNEGREYSSATVNNNIGKSVKKPAEISFSGFLSLKKTGKVNKGPFLDEFLNKDGVKKFLKNGNFKKFLLYADKDQVTFGAAFALILTGIFRPLAIMFTPSSKKNVDDKKYASAQSISSGLIGLGCAFLFSNPISTAVAKVFDEDKKTGKCRMKEFIKDPKTFELFNIPQNISDEERIAKAGAKTLAKDTFKQMGDLIPAIPKAIFTIAIIPVVLKYVFGLEKKKSTKEVANNQDGSSLSFKNSSLPQRKAFQNFTGGIN